jgi:hypothetical protein
MRQFRIDFDTEGRGDFQGVDDMQIMRPGLGEILPRVGTGIEADEIVAPGAVVRAGIMGPQRLGVIGPFVAEMVAEGAQRGAARSQ